MDKTIRRVTSPEDQKKETYRYWRGRPVGERLEEVWAATDAAYSITGIRYDATRKHEAIIVRVQRSRG